MVIFVPQIFSRPFYSRLGSKFLSKTFPDTYFLHPGYVTTLFIFQNVLYTVHNEKYISKFYLFRQQLVP